MIIQDLEPGMLCAGRNMRNGQANIREIISITGRRITYRTMRYDRGMNCTRTYTASMGDFLVWAEKEVDSWAALGGNRPQETRKEDGNALGAS